MTDKKRAEALLAVLNTTNDDGQVSIDIIVSSLICVRSEAIESCMRIFSRLADGYHFAGMLKEEKLIREHIDLCLTKVPRQY